MEANHIPLIMDRLDKIVSEDRKRKFPSRIIVKIYGMSYGSSGRFFNNHPELMNLVGIRNIPDFRILSYRALRIDWHEITAGIVDLI